MPGSRLIPKTLCAALLAILALLAAASTRIFIRDVANALTHPEQQNYTDMDIFVAAAKNYMATGQLYLRTDNLARDYAPGAGVYKFPPAYQLTIYPLLKAGIDGFRFSFVQRIIQLILYLSAGLMMLILMEQKIFDINDGGDNNRFLRWNYRLIGILFILWSTGFRDAFSGIEPEILIFFLLASSLYLLDKKPFASGVAVALAAAIKVYPGLMLLFFIATRNRPGVYGFFAGLATITSIALAVFGSGEHLFYVQHILPVLMTEPVIYHIQNTTIETMLFLDHLIPAMSGRVTMAVKLVTAAALLITCYKSFTGKTANTVTLYSLFIAAVLLCLSNYWLQYQVLLLIPVFCLLAHAVARSNWLHLSIILLVILALSIQEGAFQDYKQSVIADLLANKHFDIERFSLRHPAIDPVLRFAPQLWLVIRLRDLVFLAPLVLFLLLLRFNYLDQNAR